MKIAFFGTPEFTTQFLDLLNNSTFPPQLVVTGPDRAVGRGLTLTSPLPKVWADEHNIEVIQPEKLDDDFFDKISKTDWDLFVVVAYGKIIPERIINLPKYGTINVHYSLLPKYRGASPVETAILNGDKSTGIAIQKMKFKLDSGDVLVTKEIVIAENDTNQTLRAKLNQEAIELLVPTIKSIFDGSAIATPQDESQVSHSKKISKSDGEIDPNGDAVQNYRKYKAYFGWPGIYFFDNGKRIKVTKAHFENNQFIIDEVIPENGKRIAFAEFQDSIK